jgi:NADPH:quinone reductase-like Zn-dependent oxidoreductase
LGKASRYEDFPTPSLGPDETVIQVKVVALENSDRVVARGTHCASRQFLPKLPAIVGTDGIGMLDDGCLVGFGALRPPYGAMAERAVIPQAYAVPIPEGIDAMTAAVHGSPSLPALLPPRALR